MKLSKLLEEIEVENDVSCFLDKEISGLSNKFENEQENYIYFCYQGENVDGHNYDFSKLPKSAVLVVEKYVDSDLVQIVVNNSRKTMALMARNFYGTKNIKVVGITGTNGKTTNAFLLGHILENAGKKVGIVGTQGIYFAGKELPAKLTTPDPIDLHEIFSIMQKAGVELVVMEASAHAIALKKLEGIDFVAKVLTNITQDHLDYFETMQNYAKVKLDFMKDAPIRIFPSDDKYAQTEIYKSDDILTFGIKEPSDAFAIEISSNGNSYIMNICDYVANIKTKLYGNFNVYNVLSASLCAMCLGVDGETIKKSVESFEGAKGRFNVFNLSENRKVIIDFAHTPDGLENVLKTARAITEGKLYVLFGCGGNRDKDKRLAMGKVANNMSDFIYVTSDNPRFESPIEIINDILNGITTKKYYANADRARAIAVAIKNLKENDTLMVCGKGTENYIDIKGVKYPYSDFEEVNKNIEDII